VTVVNGGRRRTRRQIGGLNRRPQRWRRVFLRRGILFLFALGSLAPAVKALRVTVFAILALQQFAAAQALPSPAGSPEPQASPELLPESNALPRGPQFELPPDFLPGILPEFLETLPPPDENWVSPEQIAKNRERLQQIKEEAMRSFRAVELLSLSHRALTDESRRMFMRAYYHTVCNQMRKLDPSLRQEIRAYEREQIGSLAMGRSPLVTRSHRVKKKVGHSGS
jgi:hypothetical protein